MTDLPANPYAADLGDREPLDALADTPGRIQEMVQCWEPERFEHTYAPGKWTARTILVHLAQTEFALGARARLALSQEGYTAQPFSQDAWIGIDEGTDAAVALDAYVALRRMNLEMWKRLTADQRNRQFGHPEYGTLTVWWIASQMAGHDIHHLKQLAAVE